MITVSGTRLYGKVDAVPGLGHVATRFFHIDYFPLFPTQGWLVTSQKGNQWRGVQIPISAKSILITWLRAATLITAVIAGIATCVVAADNPSASRRHLTTPVVLTAGSLALLIFSMTFKGITRASYARACELARLAHLSESAMAQIAQAYGQPPTSYGVQPIPAAIASTPAPPPPQPFLVIGRDTAADRDVCTTIDAIDSAHARELAAANGIEVHQVQLAAVSILST